VTVKFNPIPLSVTLLAIHMNSFLLIWYPTLIETYAKKIMQGYMTQVDN